MLNRQTPTFMVVKNAEHQFSVWRADRALPNGWHPIGFEGSQEECLDHIDRAWTDMRPLSLQRQMAGSTNLLRR
jgi:MbtH protein